MPQPVKVYSRKTTPRNPRYSQWIPKRGTVKPKKAAPSKKCKTILGGKLASFESISWTPRIKASVQHIPVSCSIFPFLWPPYVWIFVREDNALSKCKPPMHNSKLWPICYLLKIPWITFNACFHYCYSCTCSTILWAQFVLFCFFPFFFLNMY